MSRAHERKRIVGRGVLACVLLAWCPNAFALNPALDVSQYAHTAWRFREGFSNGTIAGIAQTLDGYLWRGTEFGLLRFDGIRTVPWQPPAGQLFPDYFIRALLLWLSSYAPRHSSPCFRNRTYNCGREMPSCSERNDAIRLILGASRAAEKRRRYMRH